ncbi:MAG: dipeptide epimerase [Cyanobacteria bacterium]|nr:dipeptide epimerase [Cyanobacteriota bacterium]
MPKTEIAKQTIELDFEALDLTTKHPFGISYGTSAVTKNVLVKLRYGDYVGYGEAAPANYHNETRSTVMAVLNEWKESRILGDNPFAIEAVSRKLERHVAGNASARAAVEMAMHDIAGKICGLPLRKMLGLEEVQPPITDFTIGIDSLEMVDKKTREAVDAGYKTLKVKQGTEYDREIIKIVRDAAPDIPLRVDANGAWSPKRAIEMAKFLAEHNVQFIEQPLPKYAHKEDFRFVRERSPIPIYADESICKAVDVARLAGCIDGVVVKLAKTGGILEALRVIHTARAHSLQIMFGCMIESSVGVTAAVHLAGLVDHLDLDGALLLANDPFNGAKYNAGYLELSDAPGLGVTPKA